MNILARLSALALLVALGLLELNRCAHAPYAAAAPSATVDSSHPQQNPGNCRDEAHSPPVVAPRIVSGVHIPGEFEPQSALVIACAQMLREAPDVFVAIVEATRSRVPLIALVADANDYRDALALLKKNHVSSAGLHFLELPHDTMWIRDYGPCLVQQADGTQVMLDADYSSRGRPLDDAVPLGLAAHLKISAAPVPLCIDGGNLISNGQGLAVATEAILEADPTSPSDEQRIASLLKDMYGVQQLVLLESLLGEPTGHVDMFATFVTPNKVVVGEYDAAVDFENAQRLDRNAARLAGLSTPAGPLEVIRIPMPPCAGPTWRSYTNVVFANGTLLVPVYPPADAAGRRQVLDAFSKLLPNWKIEAIDASAIADAGGGLHCVTMNLAGLKSLPHFPRPIRARTIRDDVLAGVFVGRAAVARNNR